MIDHKLPQIAEDDPERCQGVSKSGQCNNKRAHGSLFCMRHGANNDLEKRNERVMRQYNVAKWQNRIGEFAEHQAVKTLREEIGICRLLLETTLNQCNSDMDLLLYSSKIGELVDKIRNLVTSCHKLESSMGMLLDKAAALQLSGEIVEIITRYVQDEEIVTNISIEIANALVRAETEAAR